MQNLKIPLMAALVISAAYTSVAQTEKHEAKLFKGKIVYSVNVTGNNDDLENMIKDYTGDITTVYILDDLFYLSERTQYSEKIARIDLVKKEATIKPADKTEFEKAGYYLIDDQKEALSSLLPYHFKTDLEDTGETDSIAGYLCKKFKVLKSGFVNADAVSYVWITNEILLPPSRYDIETDYIRILSPIPISVPVEGTTLKSLTTEAGITVIYTVTQLAEGARPE